LSIAFRPPSRLPKLETPVGHVTGLAVAVGGLGMIVAAVVGVLTGDPDSSLLLASGLIVGIPGGLLFWRTSVPDRISTVAIFGAVTTAWIALIFAATIPYVATGTFERYDDALFEAVSGITTTGATVLPSIEAHGPAILFWRQITQWFGGLGVVVLAVAVLPVLGVGGLELLRAETPGPTSERIAPRVRETAQRLWFLYLGLTLAAVGAFLIAGMGVYDAAAHALTMVSTGGFSPYDRSIAHFESAAIEWVGIAIMFIGAASFPLLWHGLRGRPGRLVHSIEFRAYVVFLAGMSVVASAWNVGAEGFGHDTVRHSTFAIVAASTSSGFTAGIPCARQNLAAGNELHGGRIGRGFGLDEHGQASSCRSGRRQLSTPRGVAV
jgi:trk system potassium uptake protein